MEYEEPTYGLSGGEIRFDANYGRCGTIRRATAKCCGCGEEKLCIVVDQSEGEYNPGAVCSKCADALC